MIRSPETSPALEPVPVVKVTSLMNVGPSSCWYAKALGAGPVLVWKGRLNRVFHSNVRDEGAATLSVRIVPLEVWRPREKRSRGKLARQPAGPVYAPSRDRYRPLSPVAIPHGINRLAHPRYRLC